MTRFLTKHFKAVLLLLCLFIIFPYFLACRFIHPFFDDFYFAGQIPQYGAFNFIRYFYSNWSGRYSEIILMVCSNAKISNGSNWQYALVGCITLLCLLASFFYIAQVLFKDYCSFFNRVLITLIVYAFYLTFMSEVFTAFYWYCSSYYQLCLAFIVMNIGFMITLFKGEKGWGFKCMVLLLNIFIAGFSEITVFSFAITYFSILIYNFVQYKKVDRFWLILFLVFIAFGAFNLCSPGNFVRMQVAHKGVKPGFIFSAIRAVYDLILFHGIYIFFKTPFLLLCFLFIPQAKSYMCSTAFPARILKVNPVYAILVTLLIFYLHHALSLYGAGYSLQGRVFNFSAFLFYIAFAYNLLLMLYHFSKKMEESAFNIPSIVQKIALLILLFLFNMSDNNRLLWGDLCRELPAFHRELGQRYALIENAKKSEATAVEVPAVKANPKLYIFGEDAKCQSTSFVNEEKYLKEVGNYFKITVRIKKQ
jgi:hypothetical protein